MNIEQRKHKQIIIIAPVERRLDANVAAEFKDQMMELIEQGNRFFILNLSNVEFLDSNGLGTIVSVFKALDKQGDIAISCVGDSVMSLFKITRMYRVFDIFDDEVSAIKALAARNNLQ